MGWGGVAWGVWCAGWALTTLLNALLYTSGACSRRLTGVVNPEVALQTVPLPGAGAVGSQVQPGLAFWRGGPAQLTTPGSSRPSPRKTPATTTPTSTKSQPGWPGGGCSRTWVSRRRRGRPCPADNADDVLRAPKTSVYARQRPALVEHTTISPSTTPPEPHRPHHPNHNHREHRNPGQSHHAGSTTPANRKSRITRTPGAGPSAGPRCGSSPSMPVCPRCRRQIHRYLPACGSWGSTSLSFLHICGHSWGNTSVWFSTGLRTAGDESARCACSRRKTVNPQHGDTSASRLCTRTDSACGCSVGSEAIGVGRGSSAPRPTPALLAAQRVNKTLVARRSSIARYPSAACSSGRVRSNTLPGSILRSQMSPISSGRKRRTGAGPPCR